MPVDKSDEQWKQQLTEEEYRVCRQHGTEYPGTGEYLYLFEDGSYQCKCCGHTLFLSAQKYDAGCGWPSFFAEQDNAQISRIEDYSHNMRRVEIRCGQCEAHLGHVFPDGPQPTGERYCVNSVSLKFIASEG